MLNLLRERLGTREAEAILLAVQLSAEFILLDDKEARKIAKSLNLRVFGTAGLILLGKKKGYYKQIRPVLERLEQESFRLDKKIISKILKESGELE